jgi:hypothetical protein
MLQGSDLQSHVGQQVEVSGTIVPEPKKPTRSTRSKSSTDVAGTSGSSDAGMQHLRVTSVRMLSANCSGSGTTNR